MSASFYRALSFILSACLVGCAPMAVPNEDDESGNNNSGNNNSGNNNNNNDDETDDGPDTDTDGDGENDTNSDDIVMSDNKCDDFPNYVACDPNDNYILQKCNKDGELENIECENGCLENKCAEFVTNSCKVPYILEEGEETKCETATGENYQSSCSDLNSMMAVVKFNIPKLGFYEIKTTRMTETSDWGQAFSRTCNPGDAFSVNSAGQCSVGQGANNTKYTRLFNPGEHYLFVAPHKILSQHFKFKVGMKEASATNIGYNGNIIPVYIDEENGFTESNDTTNGSKGINWPGGMGCNIGGNNGQEIVYVFSLDKAADLYAEVQISEDSNAGLVGLHLYSTGDTLGFISCAETKDKELSISKALKPGQYILAVDGTNGETFKYNIDMSLN